MEESHNTLSGKHGWKNLFVFRPNATTHLLRNLGQDFFGILSLELDEVCASKWNMEKVIVFKSVILQRAPGANSYAQIRKRILFGLDFWNCGVFDKLVKDTYNLLWDALEHLAGIKWRSNVVEGPQTSSWKEYCAKQSDSSETEKRGEFYNQTNWIRIVQEWSTRMSHRCWRGNILAKNPSCDMLET